MTDTTLRAGESLVTGKQIRAARGALNWSVRQLAEQSGVGAATISRYEAVDGVPQSRKDNLHKLRRTLESRGIRFVSDRRFSFGVLFDIPLEYR
ncbi:helix-turn-helix domain-containing protein [Ruegeria sp.]|uniref:helix-turn-helix domain-containing protein n=1 Tax=Ruegeria sp. TaxID=1879320 RepID=UPI003C79BA6C